VENRQLGNKLVVLEANQKKCTATTHVVEAARSGNGVGVVAKTIEVYDSLLGGDTATLKMRACLPLSFSFRMI
jgi:hypothetical protein